MLEQLTYQYDFDYLLTGCISDDITQYNVRIILFNKLSQATESFEIKAPKTGFENELTSIMENLIDNISSKIKNGNLVRIDYYKTPRAGTTVEYLSALGQLLMQSLVDNNLIKTESIWGERNMLNWYLNLALTDVDNPIPKIMLVSGLGKSKSYGSEIYKELKEEVIKLLVNDKLEVSPSTNMLPFVYKLFDMESEFNSLKNKLLETKYDDKYKEWLLSL